MPTIDTAQSASFAYKAVSPDGRRTDGTMVAPDERAVVKELQRQGWVPISVSESRGRMMSTDLTAWATGGGVKFKHSQRAEFMRRLHQMLKAGISPSRAIATLGEEAPKDVGAMCAEMSEKILAGERMSDVLGEHRRAFDDVTVAYIRSGEESGTLPEATERLANLLAKRAALKSKIAGVTAYPKLVGGAILLLTIGIIAFLVPVYSKIYASFDATLPAPTRVLVWLSHHLLPVGLNTFPLGGFTLFYPTLEPFSLGFPVLVVGVALWVFLKKTRKNLRVGERIDRIKFRLPLLGKLSRLQALQRWASTLSGGLEAGVPLSSALALSAQASGSRWHKRVAPHLIEAVRSGRSIASEMYEHDDLYPANIRVMVATGEETGEVDSMLNSVAESLESDIDALIAGLSAKIEVALLLVLGGTVGGLLVVLYMPILNLASAVSKGI